MSEPTTTTTTLGLHPSKLSAESLNTLKTLHGTRGLVVYHFQPKACHGCKKSGSTATNLPVLKTAWSRKDTDSSHASHKECAESLGVARSSAQAHSVQVLRPLGNVMTDDADILHPEDDSATILGDGLEDVWYFAMPTSVDSIKPEISSFVYGHLDDSVITEAKHKATTVRDKVPDDWHVKTWQQIKDLSEKEKGLENTVWNNKDADANRLLGFDVISFTPGLQEPYTDEGETPAERDGRLWDEEQ